MPIIAIQEPMESLAIDFNRMHSLVKGLPIHEAEDFFFDTVEDIAQAIGRLEQALEVDNFSAMFNVAGQVHFLANRAGFLKLAEVASHLQDAIRTGNHTALMAISHRLMRVGEQSLIAMWDERVYSS